MPDRWDEELERLRNDRAILARRLDELTEQCVAVAKSIETLDAQIRDAEQSIAYAKLSEMAESGGRHG